MEFVETTVPVENGLLLGAPDTVDLTDKLEAGAVPLNVLDVVPPSVVEEVGAIAEDEFVYLALLDGMDMTEKADADTEEGADMPETEDGGWRGDVPVDCKGLAVPDDVPMKGAVKDVTAVNCNRESEKAR